MCGINGILHLDVNQSINESNLIRMRDSLAHRGPDDQGIFIDSCVGLGHRRLSIIDLSEAAHQPFLSDDGRYALVYNGEIYNYKSFYPELLAKGISLKTKSDTEVLLHLFSLYGTQMLPRLQGMFAFAIWDKKLQQLTLVRDRMGVKPLYYTFHNETFYFASEQKALFTAGVPLVISQEGLEEFIFNRFVAGDNTLFKNVQKIVPGHVLTVQADGRCTHEKWWSLKNEIHNHQSIPKPIEWFTELFDESVRLRMVSDVPVGVFLSAGLDSSSILSSLYQQKYSDIQTYTIGFNQHEHNEADLAKRLATQFHYTQHSLQIEGESLYQHVLDATYFQDEPLMHLSEPHLLALSRLAKPDVKVVLSGEGADELMGGYVRYKALKRPSLLKAIGVIGKTGLFSHHPRLDKLMRYAELSNLDDLILYNGSNMYPKDILSNYGIEKAPQNEYRQSILKEAKELYPNNPKRQALYFDQHTYLCSLLDRNDRCTMGASIECREPFLDERLLSGLGTLPNALLFKGKKGKYILKKSMESELPAEILAYKKNGLSVPWGEYLTHSAAFKEELQAFTKSRIFEMPYFQHIHAEKLVAGIQKGDHRLLPYVMPLFMLHIWLKHYVERFSSSLTIS
jgi:asparagine synthase (glutamine-hydrolysing)